MRSHRGRELIAGLRVLLPAAGLMAVAGGYTWWWHAVAERVEGRIPQIAASVEAAGIKVDPGTVRIRGFPYRVEIVLAGASAAARNWRWEASEFRIYAQPWNLRHLVVVAGTAHEWGRPPGSTSLTTDVVRASLVHDREGVLRRISVEAVGLAAAHWSLERAELHGRRTADGMEIAGRLAAGRFPGGRAEVPVMAYALIEGVLTPGPGLSALAHPAALAGDGGLLEVSRFAFAWGPAEGDLEGTVTLDPSGRPLGALTMRTGDLPGLLRFLEGQGWAPPAAGRAVEAALAAGNPAAAAVMLPVTVQEGVLSAAGVPLLEVPSVAPPTP